MKKINLKKDHLQLYKRENSEYWQIKIKYPNRKSIRKTSGTKILEDAKNIAKEYYNNKLIFNKKNLYFNKSYTYK